MIATVKVVTEQNSSDLRITDVRLLTDDVFITVYSQDSVSMKRHEEIVKRIYDALEGK